MINAENIEDATAWGDHLSTQYSARYPYEKFLRSYSEPPEKYAIGGISSLPRIKYGHEATDDEIGWYNADLTIVTMTTICRAQEIIVSISGEDAQPPNC